MRILLFNLLGHWEIILLRHWFPKYGPQAGSGPPVSSLKPPTLSTILTKHGEADKHAGTSICINIYIVGNALNICITYNIYTQKYLQNVIHQDVCQFPMISLIVRLVESSWTGPPGIRGSYTLFFYKNNVYKNLEPHILPNLKNIFIAQIVSDCSMFLS